MGIMRLGFEGPLAHVECRLYSQADSNYCASIVFVVVVWYDGWSCGTVPYPKQKKVIRKCTGGSCVLVKH